MHTRSILSDTSEMHSFEEHLQLLTADRVARILVLGLIVFSIPRRGPDTDCLSAGLTARKLKLKNTHNIPRSDPNSCPENAFGTRNGACLSARRKCHAVFMKGHDGKCGNCFVFPSGRGEGEAGRGH